MHTGQIRCEDIFNTFHISTICIELQHLGDGGIRKWYATALSGNELGSTI